jgi:hypothetical protein
MEKSHHQAKAANQAHTSHDGGKAHISVILQQFQHWYRNIQHRYNMKLECSRSVHTPLDDARSAAAYRRRERWYQSSAAAALENWRSRRRRVGKLWLTDDLEGGNNTGFVEEEPEGNGNHDVVGNEGDEEELEDVANEVEIQDVDNE